MTQIITGPFGCVAYHDQTPKALGQYPALNLPCRAFARGDEAIGANDAYAPNVVRLPRHMRTGAALAMFGSPSKREI